jgi:hypothetical protein
MHTRRATLVRSVFLVMGLGLLCLCTETRADGACRHNLTVPLTDFDTGIAGNATLCIHRTGVRGSIEAQHLQPGDAYTVWFIYFDNPSTCVVPNNCGTSPNDFTGPQGPPPPGTPPFKAPSVTGRFDSAVAPADGEEEFAGRVGGLSPSSGGLVWLLLFVHGPADMSDHDHLARQLLTPEDPVLDAPVMGNYVDGPRGKSAAIAVFQIP